MRWGIVNVLLQLLDLEPRSSREDVVVRLRLKEPVEAQECLGYPSGAKRRGRRW
jgi:hypothetical protein